MFFQTYDAQSKQVAEFCTSALPKPSTSCNSAQVQLELEAHTAYMRTTKPKMESLRGEAEATVTTLGRLLLLCDIYGSSYDTVVKLMPLSRL
jgi:hypothetical protein